MKRKNIPSFFSFFLCAILSASSCSVSQVAVKKGEIKKITAVAIVPFDRTEGIPVAVATQAEERFKLDLVKGGLTVVERKKIEPILKELEISAALSSKSDQIISITGANTLLMGSITQYREEVQDVEYMGYDKDKYGNDIRYTVDPVTKQKVEIPAKPFKDKKHTVYFHIQIRLVSVNTGETILAQENKWNSRSFNERDGGTSLEKFKDEILKSMGNELAETIKESRKKK